MRKGQIAVDTKDIFPIIKKWLYSDHDIFVRELVSNASDALAKLKSLGKLPESPKVQVDVDPAKKTITFQDNGLGMDEAEIEKYIGQIAFSGAREFIENLKKENPSQEKLIGQFGLGFYSGFMVADRVEIFSVSHKPGSTGAYWVSDGSTDYEVGAWVASDIVPHGTRIVLHVSEESKEYLESDKLKSILKTYCSFMPFPVFLGKDQINVQPAIWTKRPSEVQEKDYLDLFHFLYPMEQDPLFWIHFNLDYPFELQSILFFPRIAEFTDMRAGNVQVFCKQVFVSDKVQDIAPEFLTMLKGIIDSPEIPLNVSRSSLQGDPKIKMISEHIVKKVADALSKRYQNEKEKFEKDWEALAPFVKVGIIQNEKFAEKAKDFLIFKSTAGDYLNLAGYQEKYGQKLRSVMADKDEKKDDKAEEKNFFVYAHMGTTSQTLIDQLTQENLAAFLTDDRIDAHLIHQLEMRNHQQKFSRIDAALDKLLVVEKEPELIVGKDQKTSTQRLQDYFNEYLKVDQLDIQVGSLKAESLPAIVKFDESSRRMAEMMKMWGRGENAPLPVKHTLVVNSNHPFSKNLLSIADGPRREELLPLLCREAYDLAVMSIVELPQASRDQFLHRSFDLLQRLTR